jgi:Txe/YoeB family toxin of Txe-Axe toxin-antitoxin module
MAYTKIKNARLLVDAVNDLALTLKYDPTNQRMIDYYNRQINLLTRRVYR